MTVIRLKYVHRFTDRYGKIRYYLRRPGEKQRPLPDPSSPDFMTAYYGLMASEPRKERTQRAPSGSVSDLISRWYQTAEFAALKDSTKAVYRRLLERMRSAEYGELPVAGMEAANVRYLVREQSNSPTTANRMLRLWGTLMQFAIDIGWRDTDPSVGIKRLRIKSKGIHSWTDAEIAQFETHWPSGSRPRLALALLLYTGQRRSDVVAMGPRAVTGERIRVNQIKTGAELQIPIHPALRVELNAIQDQVAATFLITERGRAFSVNGFYNQFIGWCEGAGLPAGCSPHGLRKAAARRLAEAGCTPHQIASITGHRSLAEVERYTRAVEQVQLAEIAMSRLDGIGKLKKKNGKLPSK
ncbi:site-specific integrase [Gluconacetobacter sacchari]|nr:site-specific integrase [Gluconacetobacter sacchari]